MNAARIITNFLAFDAAWTVAVLTAAGGRVWPGALAAGGAVGLRLAMAERSSRGAEALLILGVALAGAASDAAHLLAGTIVFGQAPGVTAGALLWFFALWANFAATLTVSLRFLIGRPWLAAALGAVGGPIAYYVAARLGAVELAAPLARTLSLVAGQYALLVGLAVIAAGRVERRGGPGGQSRGSRR